MSQRGPLAALRRRPAAPPVPRLPQQPGYNKRLRRLAGTLDWLVGALARDTSVFTDDVWLGGLHPRRVRPLPRDGAPLGAGWLGRVRLLREPLPLLLGAAPAPARHPARAAHRPLALTGAKADEGQVLLDLLDVLCADPALQPSRTGSSRPVGQVVIADEHYYGREFEADLAEAGIDLLRRARKGEAERPGGRFFRPLRQTIESIFDTLKGQLDLERHGGRTPAGVLVRVLQRLLATTAAIWHDHTSQTVRRSLLAHDH